MSNNVDTRVVQMQFDNKNFESNVVESLGTIGKLKQALNFSDSAKSFSELENASKHVTLDHLGDSVDKIASKFTLFGQIGFQVMQDIARAAVNAGETLIKSLTIDPIMSGFAEYNLKINSIQTIMEGSGESLEIVSSYLDELNTYADKTKYSFADMTNNIGKFVNAGVSLRDAVDAIMGLSNEAALVGATTEQNTHAMYNIAQALAAGYVKLIDWKSIENAQMASIGFKQVLIDTALELKTIEKTGENTYRSLTANAQGRTSEAFNASMAFNDSLQYQWMTNEVLITALKKYSDETTDFGRHAFEVAGQVKTLNEALDVLKEGAQSGWTTSWELIIGDINQATNLWTTLNNVIGDIIQKHADQRNYVLRVWATYTDGRDKVITGFKNIWKLVTDIGQEIYNAFGMTGGGYTGRAIHILSSFSDGFKKVSEAIQLDQDQLLKLRELFIKLIKVGRVVSNLFGGTFVKIIKALGPSLMPLLDVFVDLLDLLASTILAVHDWLEETFHISDAISTLATWIGNAVKSVVEWLRGNDKLVNALKTLGGWIKSVIDFWGEFLRQLWQTDQVQGVFNKIKEWFKSAYDYINSNTPGVLTNIKNFFVGIFNSIRNISVEDAINGFKTAWEKVSDFFGRIGENLSGFGSVWEGIKTFFANIFTFFKDLFTVGFPEAFQKFSDSIGAIGSNIADFFGMFGAKFEWFGQKLRDIVSAIGSFISDIKDKIVNSNWEEILSKVAVFAAVISLFKGILEVTGAIRKVGNFFDSLSETVDASGKFIREAAKNLKAARKGALLNSIAAIVVALALLIAAVIWVGSMPLETVIQGLIVLGVIVLMIKGLVSNLLQLGPITAKVGGTLTGIGFCFILLAVAMKLISTIRTDRAITTLILMLVAFVVIKGILNSVRTLGPGAGSTLKSIAAIIASFLLLAIAMKIIASIPLEQAVPAMIILIIFMMEIKSMMKIAGEYANSVKNLGNLFTQIGLCMILLAIAMKIIGTMPVEQALISVIVIQAFMLDMVIIMLATNLIGKNTEKMQKTMLSIGVCMLLLAVVLKIISSIEAGALWSSIGALTVILGELVGMMAATKLLGKDADKAAKVFQGLAIAILAITVSLLILSIIPFGTLMGSVLALGILLGVLTADLAVLNKNQNSENTKKTLIGLAIIIAVLAASIVVLTLLDQKKMWSAVLAMSILMLALGAMLKLSEKGSQLSAKSIVYIAILLYAAAGAIAILVSMNADWKVMLSSAIGLAIVMASLALAIGIIGKVGKDASKIKMSTIGCLSILLFAAAGALAIVASITNDWKILLSAAVSLGLVMAAVGASLILVSTAAKISNKIDKSLIISLGLIIALSAAALWVLTNKEFGGSPESFIPAAIGLGIVMAALGASLILVGVASRIADTIGTDLIATLAIILALSGAALLALTNREFGGSPDSFIPAATALGIVMGALSVSLIIVALASKLCDEISTASMLYMAEIIGLSAAALVLLNQFENVERYLSIAESLAIVMDALGIAFLAVAAAGAIGADITDVGTFAAFMVVIEAIAALTGAIDELTGGGFLEIMQRAVPIFEAIGEAIGSFAAALIETIGEAIIDLIVYFGKALEDFSTHIPPFAENVKAMDVEALDAIGMLAAAILVIAGADFIAAIGSIFGMHDAFSSFGTALDSIIPGLQTFIEGTAEFDEGAIDKAKVVAGVISVMADVASSLGLEGGIFEGIFGKPKSLSDFAKEMQEAIPAVAEFCKKAYETFNTAIDYTIIAERTANVIKTMSEVAAGLPKDGGLFSDILGETKDLDQFAKEMANAIPSIGIFLATARIALGDDDGTSERYTERVADIITKMSDVAKALPKQEQGSWWGAAAGYTKGLDTFAAEMQSCVVPIGLFIQDVKKYTNDSSVMHARRCANIISVMSDVAKQLPNEEADWWSALVGHTKSLKEFADEMLVAIPSVAYFASICEKYITADGETMALKAANIIGALADVAKKIPTTEGFFDGLVGRTTTLSDFANQLSGTSDGKNSIGQAVSKFCNQIRGLTDYDIKTTGYAASVIEKLNDVASKMMVSGGFFEFFTGSQIDLGTFGTQITDLATGLKNFTDTAKDVDPVAAEATVSIAESLGGLASSLPNTKDLFQQMTGGGQMSLAEFSEQLSTLGYGIKTFATIIAGGEYELGGKLFKFDTVNTEALVQTVDAITKLGETITAYSEDMSSFTNILAEMAKVGMASFIQAFQDCEQEAKDAVWAFIASVGTDTSDYVTSFIDSLDVTLRVNKHKIDKAVKHIFTNLKLELDRPLNDIRLEFSDELDAIIDDLTGTVGAMNEAGKSFAYAFLLSLIDAFKDLEDRTKTTFSKQITTGISGATSAVDKHKPELVSKLGELVTEMLDKFGGFDEAISTEVANGIINIKGGISGNQSMLVTASENLISAMIRKMNEYHYSFMNTGGHLMNGFKLGIENKQQEVVNSTLVMVSGVIYETKKLLGVHSPSKEFEKIGRYVDEGFVRGIIGGSKDVVEASKTMNYAVIQVIDKIADMIDAGIELKPIIKPVVDPVYYIQGMKDLRNMTESNPAIKSLSSIQTDKISRNSITVTANTNNSDVVQEINKLGNHITDLTRKVSNLQVVMDNGALVGQLVSPMDVALGGRSVRTSRQAF